MTSENKVENSAQDRAGKSQSGKILIIHSDGGARGNPGPAGIGVVLQSEDTAAVAGSAPSNQTIIAEIQKYIGETTNNVAEYSALLAGLNRAEELGYANIRCFLDSELVVKQLNGQYKIREPHLQQLAAEVLRLRNKFANVTFTHVRREKNSHADKLVNAAIDAHVLK